MKRLLVFLFIILSSLMLTSCVNEEEDYYDVVKLSSFSLSENGVPVVHSLKQLPAFVFDDGNVLELPALGTKKYVEIYNYPELKEIFEYTSGLKTEDYFNANLFDDNFVLVLYRYESTVTYYQYYDYQGIDESGNLKIEMVYEGDGSEALCQHLDFIVIPKTE